jgi:hypothetical protein
MRLRLTRLLTLVVSIAMIALFGGITASTVNAEPPPSPGGQKTVAVTGIDKATGQQVFTGEFTANTAQPDSSAPKGIALAGELTGQLMPPQAQGPKPGQGPGAPGNPGQGNVKQQVNMPVADIQVPQEGQNQPSAFSPGNGQDGQIRFASQQAVCNVLDLTLGPLDLNLLGLEVHLNQVHLVINANPAGGILGQLLCALAGGLPGLPGTLNTIIGLLNQILAALGGL